MARLPILEYPDPRLRIRAEPVTKFDTELKTLVADLFETISHYPDPRDFLSGEPVLDALRNALVPIITLGALELGTLLSGAVLTEQVFTIPGFGKLIVDAVFNRDYAVVQGVVLFTATAYIMLNLLADLAYFAVNPRMRS